MSCRGLYRNQVSFTNLILNPNLKIILFFFFTAPSNSGDTHKGCEKFGYFNHSYLIDRGWLTTETVIQFKLHSNPIHFWKEKLKNRKPYVKLTPVNLTKRTNSDSSQVFDALDNNSLSLDTLDIGGTSDATQWAITEIAVITTITTYFN